MPNNPSIAHVWPSPVAFETQRLIQKVYSSVYDRHMYFTGMEHVPLPFVGQLYIYLIKYFILFFP